MTTDSDGVGVVGLPELPKGSEYRPFADWPAQVSYTAEQMHAYARRALADAEAEVVRLRAWLEDASESLDQVMRERDWAQECLQNTHIALGGDGEWTGKMPPEMPPDSGDLHYDVPALAAEVTAALAAATARGEGVERDGERLDWLERAGDVWLGMIVDGPRDGEYSVGHDLGDNGYGPTLRAAIDAAIAAKGAGGG